MQRVKVSTKKSPHWQLDTWISLRRAERAQERLCG
jgi:hypothetical protein